MNCPARANAESAACFMLEVEGDSLRLEFGEEIDSDSRSIAEAECCFSAPVFPF